MNDINHTGKQSLSRATDFVGEYIVRVSRRAKTWHLEASPEQGLIVVVPRGFDHSTIPAILESERDWIEENAYLLGTEKKVPPPTEINLRAACEVWRVEYLPARHKKIALAETGPHRLSVSGDISNYAAVIAELRAWLNRRASALLPPIVDAVSWRADMPYGKIQVRDKRTTWASCSETGTISLNQQLIFVPGDIVRYILLHELCHTIHLDHSKKFWALVGRYEPKYKELRAKLGRNQMSYVPDWAE